MASYKKPIARGRVRFGMAIACQTHRSVLVCHFRQHRLHQHKQKEWQPPPLTTAIKLSNSFLILDFSPHKQYV